MSTTSTNLEMKKLFIVDASGFLFRSYYAINNMTTTEGKSTNALFGFVRALFRLMKDFSPTHLVVVFEGKDNKHRRREVYPEYKANRSPIPEDLPQQILWAEQFCKLHGIPTLNAPEVESDDVMGTIAKWAPKTTQVYICTSDKDMAQVVSPNVHLLHVHKQNKVIDPAEVKNLYGVEPEQVIDWLAIMGDTSDNIPGIPGFGAKTAQKMLEEFGSLTNLLDNPDKVSGKKKQQTLVENRELALISQKLASLFLDIDVPQREEFYALKAPDEEALEQFYKDMNFKSLQKEGGTAPIEEKTDYICIHSEEDLIKALQELKALKKPICLDTETTSIHPLRAEIVGVGLGSMPGRAFYIPFNGSLDNANSIKHLSELFLDTSCTFYGHNIKYDLHIFENMGLPTPSLSFDTMVASYVLRAHNPRHSLDYLTLEYFQKEKISTESLIGKGKKAITMDRVPIEQVAHYCCEDIDYTCRLKEVLEKELEERELEPLFYGLELPLIPILFQMEREGIFLDVETLSLQKGEIEKQIEELVKSIHTQAGGEFNLNSPKQLGEVLFEKLKIPPPKKTATGYSTSAEVLEKLKKEHPIANDILSYRQLEKLRSSYLESLPQDILPRTERIHCSFNQSVASTGRLSCQHPNLQTIPTRSEVGRRIREAFRPQKTGWCYLAADYSQIELRILAHLSQDAALLNAFNHGKDIHSYTASLVFDVPIEQVSREQRYQAKTVNFGIIYGQQAFGLSQEIGVSVKQAKEFIQAYFNQYPQIEAFLESCKEKTRETGKAVTMFGRERLIPDIQSKNPFLRQAAERLAVNTPIQGSEADLIKQAMINVEARLAKEGMEGKMILQIHDELLFEVPEAEIPPLKELIKEEMEGVIQLSVPLTVDLHVGKNWKEC